jgi:hypothetical protein
METTGPFGSLILHKLFIKKVKEVVSEFIVFVSAWNYLEPHVFRFTQRVINANGISFVYLQLHFL